MPVPAPNLYPESLKHCVPGNCRMFELWLLGSSGTASPRLLRLNTANRLSRVHAIEAARRIVLFDSWPALLDGKNYHGGEGVHSLSVLKTST